MRHGPFFAALLLMAGLASAVFSEDILATVTGERVRLRQGPSEGDGIAAHLNTGDRVVVLATPEDKSPWVQVRAVNLGVTGWMHSQYLRLGARAGASQAAYETELLLCTTPAMVHGAWRGHGAVVAQVRFCEGEQGLLRCTIGAMHALWRDEEKETWGVRVPVSRVPFTDVNDLEWRDADGGTWQVGQVFLVTTMSIWRRTGEVPDLDTPRRGAALTELGVALGELGKAFWTGSEWRVSGMRQAPDLGAAYLRVGDPGREVYLLTAAPPEP